MKPSLSKQSDLFMDVVTAFIESPTGQLSNSDLYSQVCKPEELEVRVPIGKSGELHNPVTRKVRWHLQTLRDLGIVERVTRGEWKLTQVKGKEMKEATEATKMVAFSTDLGIAIWSRCESVFPYINEDIHLCITSPEYFLRTPRAYGNCSAESEYVDFICKSIEPIVKKLVQGGSIVINISEDIFESKLPSRSMYVERLVLALHDRLSLSLMARIPWVNWSKPPSPTYWACRQRVQLASAYEHVFWFTNCPDPTKVRSDNRRVLEAHTVKHQALLAAGGEKRNAVYGDGAYQIRANKSFSAQTAGKIPRNVIERGHNCADTRFYRKEADRLGLPKHGAMYPTSIPEFFVKFLTEPGELVVDLFGGTGKTALAAERLGRRWIITDKIYEYLRGGAELFRSYSGFQLG